MTLAEIILADPVLMDALTRLRTEVLPQWRIVSGGLYQTVWNVLTGRPRGTGIVDIDVIYFDAGDLSWDAEDAIIGRFPPPFQVHNQARVHLWFEKKFGIAVPPLRSADEALIRYPAVMQAAGVRLEADGRLDIAAPFGLEDIFSLTMRPNRRLNNRLVYDAKAERIRAVWPEVTVVPWDDG